MKEMTHTNWASVITAALSGIGGGVMLGGSLLGITGAISGGLIGAVICALSEVNREKRLGTEQKL